ncbi:MAG: GTP-binding protein [Actinomycetia bacterium]|nr:GTP-binding protein [Actinomycetes bacterium]
MDDNIMVTVIGGYLGAGKTTLVNHILRTADERIAVLVNDFGDINIDADLIESQDGETLSLANGCICCSLVDGFAAALATIEELERRPERLVIEASGVADPATVAAYGHSPGLELDAVVVMADAETIRQRAVDQYVGDTVLAQLDSADIIVLNKIDLVPTDDVVTTRVWLQDRAPDAVVVDARDAKVGPAVLFGFTGAPRAGGAGLAAGLSHTDHGPAGDHGHADELFESWSWAGEGALERSTIEALMEHLPEGVVRAKGVLSLSDDPDHLTVLQRVGGRWSLRPGRTATSPPTSQLVIIALVGTFDGDWLAGELGQSAEDLN